MVWNFLQRGAHRPLRGSGSAAACRRRGSQCKGRARSDGGCATAFADGPSTRSTRSSICVDPSPLSPPFQAPSNTPPPPLLPAPFFLLHEANLGSSLTFLSSQLSLSSPFLFSLNKSTNRQLAGSSYPILLLSNPITKSTKKTSSPSISAPPCTTCKSKQQAKNHPPTPSPSSELLPIQAA